MAERTPLRWLDNPVHAEWLRQEERRLLAFPHQVVSPGGGSNEFGFDGAPTGTPNPTFNTARLAHVYALALLRGYPDAAATALPLLDWLHAERGSGWPDSPTDPGRSLYTLAFVILAAAAGVTIGHQASTATLQGALGRLDTDFADDRAPQLARARIGAADDGYRGLNGIMHLTESLFAAAHATSDDTLRRRAQAICQFVADTAADRNWRIREHFDREWRPQESYHRELPDDPFEPYGATAGHGFEWARLIVSGNPDLTPAAVALFDRADQDGWRGDGFVYTTDWTGAVVSRRRLHWVAAEAVAAAAVLYRRTGDPRFAARYETWLQYIAQHHIDTSAGSWHHELDGSNRPLIAPKPDLYHAYQAVVIPQLPVADSLIAACARGLG